MKKIILKRAYKKVEEAILRPYCKYYSCITLMNFLNPVIFLHHLNKSKTQYQIHFINCVKWNVGTNLSSELIKKCI